MTALKIEEHVAKLVANWPALTDDQLNRIAGMLRTGVDAVRAGGVGGTSG